MGAAADFSAFGGTLDEEPLKVTDGNGNGIDGGAGGFDLGIISEQARRFEEDFRRGRSSSNSKVSSGSTSATTTTTTSGSPSDDQMDSDGKNTVTSEQRAYINRAS